MKIGDARLRAAQNSGGFGLGLAVDVDLAAGLGMLGGELAEAMFDEIECFEFLADGTVWLRTKDRAELLVIDGERANIRRVRGVAAPAIGDEAPLYVSQGSPDAVAGECGEP